MRGHGLSYVRHGHDRRYFELTLGLLELIREAGEALPTLVATRPRAIEALDSLRLRLLGGSSGALGRHSLANLDRHRLAQLGEVIG